MLNTESLVEKIEICTSLYKLQQNKPPEIIILPDSIYKALFNAGYIKESKSTLNLESKAILEMAGRNISVLRYDELKNKKRLGINEVDKEKLIILCRNGLLFSQVKKHEKYDINSNESGPLRAV